ncbi:pirin family protein [Luteithermobacter gelatinilyticus]|uniref:pirin family protein n=1 Tax=Luteithermobacter gelatinilyticus TaxID=2582913 RepID=UPI0011072836|nr:pirin family protein [Luteithermobacter gelatinilyticus]
MTMGIELLIPPRRKDLGGFSVRRLLPYAKRRMVGPWIFFDHMGPVSFPAGKGVNVRPHPHINLATVTYLFDGEILHRDSLGSYQVIRPGDINLMLAGRGIVHSEREHPEVRHSDHVVHGLQLWLALPEQDEERPPAFYHYPAQDIPVVTAEGVTVRVMMGTAYGVTSSVETYAETLYVEADLRKGQRLVLPESEQRAVYVAGGALTLADGFLIPAYHLAVVTPGAGLTLEAVENTRVAVIGGEHMAKRHIYWNFVSSRKDRIDQAKRDWKDGRFPKIPGDEEEFIVLPEE